MVLDPRSLKAATFLVQALGLPDRAETIASDLVAVDDGHDVAVYAAELDSTVGPAAFLVYVYTLSGAAGEVTGGRARFDADLETIRTAAERGVPGPRLVAHAIAGTDAFLLATTPATLRALSGDAEPVPPPPVRPVPDNPGPARAEAATELLRLLRAADTEAAAWLAAADSGALEPASFTPAETELALFLLDERSIMNLLRVLDLIISAAKTNAARAMDVDPVT
jgi:hypothetical protein